MKFLLFVFFISLPLDFSAPAAYLMDRETIKQPLYDQARSSLTGQLCGLWDVLFHGKRVAHKDLDKILSKESLVKLKVVPWASMIEHAKKKACRWCFRLAASSIASIGLSLLKDQPSAIAHKNLDLLQSILLKLENWEVGTLVTPFYADKNRLLDVARLYVLNRNVCRLFNSDPNKSNHSIIMTHLINLTTKCVTRSDTEIDTLFNGLIACMSQSFYDSNKGEFMIECKSGL